MKSVPLGQGLQGRLTLSRDVMPDCKDAWATKSSSSSLSHFMNRVFELQCQNRHPEPKGKPSKAPEPRKN